MPKVYVLNRGAHDYSMAERFGELVYLSDGMLGRVATGQMYRMLYEGLADAQPEDFILLSSLTTLCSIATGIMVAKHGAVNLLLFHKNAYVSRRINFNKE